MTFVLTEDQEMLRDTAMNFTRDELPVKHLRTLRDSGKNGVDPDIRKLRPLPPSVTPNVTLKPDRFEKYKVTVRDS